MANPDLNIQIVNFKTKSYLIPLLASLEKDLNDTNLTYAVSILDNNSGDDLKDIKQTYPKIPISIYYSDKNGGFGAGHNFLASHSEAKYIFLLNPDVLFIEPNTIGRLVKSLEENQAAVIGPKLVTQTVKIPGEYDSDKLRPQQWDHGRIGSDFIFHPDNKLTKVAWVCGAVFLVNRQVFNKAGGFDENFFLYKEEEDLCIRIRKLSQSVYYDPSIQALHYGSVVANKRKNAIKSNLYFRLKHPLYPWIE